MDGVGRLIGGGNITTLAGRAVMLRPLTLGLIGVCENNILSSRPNMVEQMTMDAMRLGSRELAEKVRERATQEIRRNKSLRVVSIDQMQDWLRSREGLAFTAWLCLRGTSPLADAGPEALRSHFASKEGSAEAKEFERRRDVCSGLDLMSVLDWPEPYRGPKDRKKPAGPRYMEWKRVFRYFAREFGWTPEQTGTLTLYGLHTFIMDDDAPGLSGTASVSADDARAMAGMSPEDRQAYLTAAAAERSAMEG